MLTYKGANAKFKYFLEENTGLQNKLCLPWQAPNLGSGEANAAPREIKQMGEREQGRRHMRLGNDLKPSGRESSERPIGQSGPSENQPQELAYQAQRLPAGSSSVT